MFQISSLNNVGVFPYYSCWKIVLDHHFLVQKELGFPIPTCIFFPLMEIMAFVYI